MNGKRWTWLVGSGLVVAMVLAMAAPAMAASSVTVNAQVEPEAYSITLDDGANLDYGTMDMGYMTSPLDAHEVVVRNIGTADVKLDMIGTDASNGSDTWTLSDVSCGADQFRWSMRHPGWFETFLNPDTAVTIAGSLATGDSLDFVPELRMPDSTTGAGHYYWSGTIYASAVID